MLTVLWRRAAVARGRDVDVGLKLGDRRHPVGPSPLLGGLGLLVLRPDRGKRSLVDGLERGIGDPPPAVVDHDLRVAVIAVELETELAPRARGPDVAASA